MMQYTLRRSSMIFINFKNYDWFQRQSIVPIDCILGKKVKQNQKKNSPVHNIHISKPILTRISISRSRHRTTMHWSTNELFQKQVVTFFMFLRTYFNYNIPLLIPASVHTISLFLFFFFLNTFHYFNKTKLGFVKAKS